MTDPNRYSVLDLMRAVLADNPALDPGEPRGVVLPDSSPEPLTYDAVFDLMTSLNSALGRKPPRRTIDGPWQPSKETP